MQASQEPFIHSLTTSIAARQPHTHAQQPQQAPSGRPCLSFLKSIRSCIRTYITKSRQFPCSCTASAVLRCAVCCSEKQQQAFRQPQYVHVSAIPYIISRYIGQELPAVLQRAPPPRTVEQAQQGCHGSSAPQQGACLQQQRWQTVV